jgi:hypothetical protein
MIPMTPKAVKIATRIMIAIKADVRDLRPDKWTQ